MLAKLTRELPEGDGLFYEPKWDGFRCIVFRDGDDVVLGSRNEKPLTRYFPELIESHEDVPESSPRVLLVDDDDLFRRGLRTLLEDEGVDVVGDVPRRGPCCRAVSRRRRRGCCSRACNIRAPG